VTDTDNHDRQSLTPQAIPGAQPTAYRLVMHSVRGHRYLVGNPTVHPVDEILPGVGTRFSSTSAVERYARALDLLDMVAHRMQILKSREYKVTEADDGGHHPHPPFSISYALASNLVLDNEWLHSQTCRGRRSVSLPTTAFHFRLGASCPPWKYYIEHIPSL